MYYEVPVLMTNAGPVEVLVEYFVDHWRIRSPSWMTKVVRAVRLFIQYLYSQPGNVELRTFKTFRHRLLTGTTTQSGDPSNLWWSARPINEVNRIIANLSDFFGWWQKKNPNWKNPADTWNGNRYDLLVAKTAYEYRRNQAFLGHTWATADEAARSKSGSSKKFYSSPRIEQAAPPSFPEDRILDLLFKGFKVGRRYNYRDMLITLLMNGAGFRESEPFHLYLWDVTEDPVNKGQALVLIHHPSFGSAPMDPAWRDIRGNQRTGQRTEYLAEQFGLMPRDWGLSSPAAGWKGGMHEKKLGGYYKQAYWFVPEFGRLFWEIWQRYIEQIVCVPPLQRNHPYAFMNIARKPLGEIYKIGKFEVSHAAAVRRIGLVPAKHLGTSPHGHRHAFGQRLRKAGVPRDMIRRFLHHSDLNSQNVYTLPSNAECLQHLEIAQKNLDEVAMNLKVKLANTLNGGRF